MSSVNKNVITEFVSDTDGSLSLSLCFCLCLCSIISRTINWILSWEVEVEIGMQHI